MQKWYLGVGWGAINTTINFGFVVIDEFIYSVQERIEAADKPNYFSVFQYFNPPVMGWG